ncbi:MAG: hypothetical protein BA869_05920 [Desulfuromonadales bacterium C00003107]|jgi:DNA-binding response OmpR family regulator|nr:MAG: hypothetical protein BA869_05920 [Desulfuromonadales bacterium C00003107]
MPSILVIGDDKTKRETLAMNLRAEGFEVYTAEDEIDGVEMKNTKHPNLMILDTPSPKLRGSNIRRCMQKAPDVPIVVLSTWDSDADIVIGLNTGEEDPIIIPPWFGRVFNRIQDIKRQIGSPSLVTELNAGALRLDLVVRKAFLGDKKIQLSPREFNLLATFIHNIGAVLSREYLLSRVWGNDCQVNLRTVDVHVRWLREKVEDDPSNPKFIITVR